MPEKEFEIYLSVLSKLLRLSPAQKAAISDELRDHMEERLESLIKTGVSRDEAIKTAMDEFGDVTGLALDLTKVSRTPLRKIVIGSTLTASIVAALIVGWVTLFAPQHRNVAPALAQAQSRGGGGGQDAKPAILVDEELFPAFLTNRTDVDFVDLPLTEACKKLEELHGVPIFVNGQRLADEDIPLDTEVSLQLHGLSFEEVLNHLTRPSRLAWYIDAGIVQITTLSDEEERFVTRKWGLRPLIKRGHTIDSLLQAFQHAGGKWIEVDGEGGTISAVGETIVVRQTFKIQRRIAQLVAAVERNEPMLVLQTCTDRERLLGALNEPCSVELFDKPLNEAFEAISASQKIAIQLDKQAISDEGINLDAEVSLILKKRPLKKVLDLMIGALGLTYVIRDGAIFITTQTAADEEMEWVVYNIGDFANSKELVTEVHNAIIQSTGGKWLEIDGEGGSIVPMARGCMLITQTGRVHTEIQNLLAQLRQSPPGRGDEGDKTAAPSAMVTKTYRMPKEVASDLLGAIPSLVAPTSWTPNEGEKPMIQLIASSPIMDHVDGLASGGNLEIHVINVPAEPKKHAAPAAKQPPGSGKEQPANTATEVPATTSVKSIVARPSSVLIIRQTPEVHREIQKFLRSLNVRFEPGMEGGGMGGGFMGGGGGGSIGGMGGGGGHGGGFF